MCHERFRPRFHFTAPHGWLNDPVGLVYYAGEYHLFYQHNPNDVMWGAMHWGHAVSNDLLHWQHLPIALAPDDLGTIFSGSAAVDWHNSSRLSRENEPLLVVAYTSAGEHATPAKPYTQSLATSLDRGRSWQKYAGNPVLGNISGGADRDPRIFWHTPTERWVMVLYLDREPSFGIFNSTDLLHWQQVSSIPGFYECPDLFELPVVGQPGETRWVLIGADGGYLVGRFDGQVFTPESEKLTLDHGYNFYASQTWNDIPQNDGRCIQMAWMRGGQYPDMPFNQQMAIPCELSLHATQDGLRMFRWPVREVEGLNDDTVKIDQAIVIPGSDLLTDIEGFCFGLSLDLDLSEARGFTLEVFGEKIVYDKSGSLLTCCDMEAPLPTRDGHLSLRILVDVTSIEIFAFDGAFSMSNCYLPHEGACPLCLQVNDGRLVVKEMRINHINSL
jgi:sucrose-6-phosphate hydrolase SacC (GH32 family)